MTRRGTQTPETGAQASSGEEGRTPEAVKVLVETAKRFNAAAVAEHGGPLVAQRAPGLLEQAIAAPFQTYGGEELYPEPFDKAAALLRGLTSGHPFTDGNKRVAFLVAAYFLAEFARIAEPATLDVDAAEALCLRVASGEERDVSAIAVELQRLWTGPSPRE